MNRFALCSVLAFAGCGLIDPNIADFDLSLPEKELVINTSQWELTSESAMPAIDCSGNAEICSSGIEEVCAAEGVCFSTCNSEQTCDLEVLVNLWHSFDLAKEKPELEEIEGKPLVSVTITKVAYRITENTMNVDSPEMTVYVAPAGIMIPGDSQAEAIGTLAPVPAGITTEDMAVDLTPDGQERLAAYMKEYSVPFNLIVGAELDIQAGDVMPTGRLTAVVIVSAVAGI